MDRIVPVIPVLFGALDSFNGHTSIVLQYVVMLKPGRGASSAFELPEASNQSLSEFVECLLALPK